MIGLPLIMFAMERTLITRAIRFILSLADHVVYYFISAVFQAIFDISSMPFETDILDSLTGKVYVILSVFMFFKITVSLISYLVNPDTMTDKQVGVGKLASRVIVTLIMIIALPFAFNELMSDSLNQGVLETLPRLIIGSDANQESLGKNGDYISWNVLKGFVHNNMECLSNENLDSNIEEDKLGTDSRYKMDGKPTATVVLENINLECESDADMYHYDYTPLISTIAGVFLLYILIGIAINVGVRAFKLMILRLIAPIPIISYMDPKSSKDGAFNKWLKMIGTTWAQLYIHLGILYFVVFLMKELIGKSDGSAKFSGYLVTVGGERAVYLTIFMILALFFFAKQAPKFLSDALGLKGDSFGDIFKMAGAGVGVAAAGGAMIGAGIAGFRASRSADVALGRGNHFLKNLGAGILGAGAGGLAGAGAALNAKDHNSRAALDAIRKRNQSNLEFGRNGGTFLGALGADASRFFTGDTAYDRDENARKAKEEELKDMESTLSAEKARTSHLSNITNRVNSKAAESTKTSGTYNGITGNYRSYHSAFEAAQSGAGVYKKYEDSMGHVIDQAELDRRLAAGDSMSNYSEQGSYFLFNGQEVDMTQAADIDMGLLDKNKDNYYEQAINDRNFDSAITDEVDLYGGTMASSLSGHKAETSRQTRSQNERSDYISSERRKISNERSSSRTQAQKANVGRHGGGRN